MSRVGGGLSLASRDLMRGMRGGEVVEPAARGAELVAVLVVVLLLPARPDAEDQPALRDVVDGARHVGQQFRVAVRVAGHQRADLEARRLLGPGAQHRPALVVRTVGIAVEREEVIPVERDVDTDVLTAAHRVADMAVLRGVLRLQLHADANREAHVTVVQAQTPICPSAFHTATTDGRAVPLPPSGQRDSGLSMLLSSFSPGCCTHTVTRSSVMTGPARFGAERHGEELLGLSAVRPVECDGEQPVVGVQRVAVGGDPQVAVAVERQVVRAGDRADLRLVESGEVGVGGRGIAAHQQQLPGEVGARVVVGDLEDLSALVVVARVGGVGRAPRPARRARRCW